MKPKTGYETICVAMMQLRSETGSHKIKHSDITVRSWSLNPKVFGLKGYQDTHLSDKAVSCLYPDMKRKALISRVAECTYTLLPQGINVAEKFWCTKTNTMKKKRRDAFGAYRVQVLDYQANRWKRPVGFAARYRGYRGLRKMLGKLRSRGYERDSKDVKIKRVP